LINDKYIHKLYNGLDEFNMELKSQIDQDLIKCNQTSIREKQIKLFSEQNMKVIKEKIDIIRDKRGIVFNPIHQEELAAQKNVHIVITSPGFIRGNHFHKKGTETLTVYGPALIRLKEQGKIKDIILSEDSALRITIPPGISHAIKNNGNKSNLLVAFNTLAHNPRNPDVFPDLLIDNNSEE
jgi:dTDP-4-dehydrorhamnose 3,5-epimerase-like enzyme